MRFKTISREGSTTNSYLLTFILQVEKKDYEKGIMERKQSSSFRRIFTVAFFLFLAPT